MWQQPDGDANNESLHCKSQGMDGTEVANKRTILCVCVCMYIEEDMVVEETLDGEAAGKMRDFHTFTQSHSLLCRSF